MMDRPWSGERVGLGSTSARSRRESDEHQESPDPHDLIHHPQTRDFSRLRIQSHENFGSGVMHSEGW